MGRKTLAFLLSLALCLGLLPSVGQAVDNVVAEVNGTTYNSLAEAIEKAEGGSTVELLADVQTKEKITIENKPLTIDLNKKTWKRTGTFLKTDSNADVTVKNGTMDFTVEVGTDSSADDREADAIAINGGSSLTLENMTFSVKDGNTAQGSTVPGYAVRVTSGSLTVRGSGEYKGRIYVNSPDYATAKLYGGTYAGIDLGKDTTYASLLDKGYIFVDAGDQYINPNSMKDSTKDLKVRKCTHADEEMKDGYYSQCGAECEHVYDGSSGQCKKCSQSLAAQVTDASGTKYYINLYDAIENAAEGSTVKLLRDASGALTVSTPIKLDCNGHTINDSLTVSGNVTLASLLPEGYAFKDCYKKEWINDSDLSGKTELTNVTTAEAPIRSVTAENPTMTITLGQSVMLTANLEYSGDDSGFHLTWYCDGNQKGSNDITTMNKPYSLGPLTPGSTGTYTYRLVFTKDGYSKSCEVQVTVIPICTVTFEANGGTLTGEETATSGADGRISEPTTPTRDGYTFDGWYLGDAKYDFTAPVTQDITLTAHWKKNSTSSGGSSSSTTYPITAPDKTESGSVTVDAKSAKRGSSVTITVTLEKGYALETLTVLDKDGKECKLTDKGDGKFTFTMPAGRVEVKATFLEDASMLNYFVDVQSGDAFYDAVLWAAEQGITSGTDAVHFSPNAPCTRAQIVSFLWRAAGSPVVNYAMDLTDVAGYAYYAEAVRWALSEGITTGTSADKFSPDATCTREQAVTFLWRAAGSPAVSSGSAFADVGADAYYESAVAWAEQNGVTNGISQAFFGSGNDCTRAQIVTFLYRAEQNK